MTDAEFEEIFKQTNELCKNTLWKKKAEYTDLNVNAHADRVSNFKSAAYLMGTDYVTALKGMMVKHTVSIYDYMRRHMLGESIDLDSWDEKIIDHINYLHLLRGILIEMYETGGKDG